MRLYKTFIRLKYLNQILSIFPFLNCPQVNIDMLLRFYCLYADELCGTFIVG